VAGTFADPVAAKDPNDKHHIKTTLSPIPHAIHFLGQTDKDPDCQLNKWPDRQTERQTGTRISLSYQS
jgi:hypothetical protein